MTEAPILMTCYEQWEPDARPLTKAGPRDARSSGCSGE